MPRFTWLHQNMTPEEHEEHIGPNGTVNDEPTLTQQHHKDACDLQLQLERMGYKDGSIPPSLMHAEELYEPTNDLSNFVDLKTILDHSAEAEYAFQQYPAALRARFGNSWQKLARWINDPNNAEEAASIGLLSRKNVPSATASSGSTKTTASSAEPQGSSSTASST